MELIEASGGVLEESTTQGDQLHIPHLDRRQLKATALDREVAIALDGQPLHHNATCRRVINRQTGGQAQGGAIDGKTAIIGATGIDHRKLKASHLDFKTGQLHFKGFGASGRRWRGAARAGHGCPQWAETDSLGRVQHAGGYLLTLWRGIDLAIIAQNCLTDDAGAVLVAGQFEGKGAGAGHDNRLLHHAEGGLKVGDKDIVFQLGQTDGAVAQLELDLLVVAHAQLEVTDTGRGLAAQVGRPLQIDVGRLNAPEILRGVAQEGGILQLEGHHTQFGAKVGQPSLEDRFELAVGILRPPDLEDNGQFAGIGAGAKLHGRFDLDRLDASFGDQAQRLADHLEGRAKFPILHPHFDAANAQGTVDIFELGKLEDQRGVGGVKIGYAGVVSLQHLHQRRFKLSRGATLLPFDHHAGNIHEQTAQAEFEGIDGSLGERTIIAPLGKHGDLQVGVFRAIAQFEANRHSGTELLGEEIKFAVDLRQLINATTIFEKGFGTQAGDKGKLIRLIALHATLSEDRHGVFSGQKDAARGRIDKEPPRRHFAASRGVVKDKGAHQP